MAKRKITWDKQAIIYFRETIKYIRKDSLQNAENVKQGILERINELSERPEIHAADKYKTNNTGHYRAFELYHLRVSYLVKDDEVIIARVRSTKQEPRDY